MMNLFLTYPLYALIISNAVLLIGAAVAMLRFERLIRRNRSFWDSPTGASVREKGDPDGLLSAPIERRLAMLHERVDALVKQKIPAAAAQPAELPIEFAIRMAKHGASIDDLTRACGLNKAEAHLMWRLHAQQRKAAATSV